MNLAQRRPRGHPGPCGLRLRGVRPPCALDRAAAATASPARRRRRDRGQGRQARGLAVEAHLSPAQEEEHSVRGCGRRPSGHAGEGRGRRGLGAV